MSDKEILNNLGLRDYKIVIDEKEKNSKVISKRYLFLTEDSNWTHLMDGWLCGVWFEDQIYKRIKELSSKFEIFCCGVQDYGFDFYYLKESKIIRHYEFDIEKTGSNRIVKDIGRPFPIEKEALDKEDDYEKIITIAKSLGINLEHKGFPIKILFF